jgi:hypothetical protein
MHRDVSCVSSVCPGTLYLQNCIMFKLVL